MIIDWKNFKQKTKQAKQQAQKFLKSFEAFSYQRQAILLGLGLALLVLSSFFWTDVNALFKASSLKQLQRLDNCLVCQELLNNFFAKTGLVKPQFKVLQLKEHDQVNQAQNQSPSCDQQLALQQAKNCTLLVLTDQGHGSGFFIKDNYVVTNKHVIQAASQVWTWVDGQKIELQVYNYAQDVDLAILKIADTKNFNDPKPLTLTTCNWAAVDSIKLAQTLYAVGWPNSPDGESSITRGIFSRFIKTDQGPLFIQTDAAINPGNSGGPLVNNCGVVGINTAKIAWSQHNVPAEGFSFALAADYAQTEVEQLIQTGQVHQLPIKDLGQIKYTPQQEPYQPDSSQESSETIVKINPEAKESWQEARSVTREMQTYWQSTEGNLDQAKFNQLKDLLARMSSVVETIVPKIENDQVISQEEQRLLTEWTKMYEQAVALEGELHQQDYFQGYYHYQCQNNSCVLTAGRGVDKCGSGNDCLPEYHYECRDLSCQVVEGAGENSCSSHDDCYYYACEEVGCTKKAGQGADQCFFDWQCQ